MAFGKKVFSCLKKQHGAPFLPIDPRSSKHFLIKGDITFCSGFEALSDLPNQARFHGSFFSEFPKKTQKLWCGFSKSYVNSYHLMNLIVPKFDMT